MFLTSLIWWILFIGSFAISMSFFLSWISGEENSIERISISIIFGFACVLIFLSGSYLDFF